MNACACPTCGQTLPEAGMSIDMDAGIIVRNGRFAHLTEREFDIFTRLNAQPMRVVSKETLHSLLYDMRGGDDDPMEKIIDVFICKLRKKLKPLGIVIETVWARGWRITTTLEASAS